MSRSLSSNKAVTTKLAIDILHGKRKSKPVHGLMDRLVFGPEERDPPNEADIANWQSIADYMEASKPVLSTAKIMTGRVDPAELVNQVERHKHHDSIFERLESTRDQVARFYANVPRTAMEHMGASYHPYAHSVILNERSPGALIHELGHGVDLAPRDGEWKTKRHMRWALKPLLWQELSAWKKGRKAYQEGYAADPSNQPADADHAQYQDNMRSYNSRKYPAFGSYLGGALGGLGGLAAGTAGSIALADGVIPQLAILGGLLGGVGGAYGGAMAGGPWARFRQNANDRKAMRQLQKLLRDPERLQRVTERLLQQREAKTVAKDKQTKPRQKAAAVKQALSSGAGGGLGDLTGATLGRVLGAPGVLYSTDFFRDPSAHGRREAADELAQDVADVRPQELSDTLLRYGSSDIVDDMFWKRERGGESLPWYRRLGGRLMQNPRTSLLGKLTGLISTPAYSVISPLLRNSHYNSATDVVNQAFGSESKLTHNLGRAIDFNKRKPSDNWLRRQGQGLLRDGYSGAQVLPFGLWHTAAGNRKSEQALREAYQQNPERLIELLKKRQGDLPAQVGEQLGESIGNPFAALVGAAIGKAYGLSQKGEVEKEEQARSAQKDQSEKQPQQKAAGAQPAPVDLNVVAQNLQLRIGEYNQKLLLNRLLRAGVGMAGVGAGLRGLAGMAEQANRNTKEPVRPATRPNVIELPVYDKRAGVLGDAWQQAKDVVRNATIGPAKSVGGFLAGEGAGSIAEQPLSLALLTATGGAGMYGGWKGVDKLLDTRRRQELDTELERAKREYELALQPKSASALGRSLDQLCDAAEKRGTEFGKLLNLYTLLSLATGTAGFAAGRQYGLKNRRRDLLESAQRQRRRQQFQSQPIYALPRHEPALTAKPEPLHAGPRLLSRFAHPQDEAEA